MKTTAVRLYGKNDLRFETFEMPTLNGLWCAEAEKYLLANAKPIVWGENDG